MAVDYPTRSATVIVANAVLMVVTGIFIIIRFWVRVFLLHQVGLDDVLIWVASVFGFTLAISEILSMFWFPVNLLILSHRLRLLFTLLTPTPSSDKTRLGSAH
jgi:hypothetical protein